MFKGCEVVKLLNAPNEHGKFYNLVTKEPKINYFHK